MKAIRTVPRIDTLFTKVAHGKSSLSADELSLNKGEGIQTDVACSSASPRQVLLIRVEELAAFNLPSGYLKENIAIAGLCADEFQPGRLIQFKDGAVVHLTFHCEPCKSIASRIPDLTSIIRRRGLLGVVTQSGKLSVGQECKSTASNFDAMSSIPRERVCQIVSRIPRGKVLDYTTLLLVAGLQRVYFRAIPNYLKTARALGLPAHRVVTSRYCIPDFMPEALQRLSHEVEIANLNQSLWEPRILELLSTNPLLATLP
jgi:alkylated DNA nucleotide flippase Atl1